MFFLGGGGRGGREIIIHKTKIQSRIKINAVRKGTRKHPAYSKKDKLKILEEKLKHRILRVNISIENNSLGPHK